MTTPQKSQPINVTGRGQAPLCHFPPLFQMTMPRNPNRANTGATAASEEPPSKPRHAPDGLVERAMKNHIARHGGRIARQELAGWIISPQVRTTEDGATTVELFTDPDGNPVLSWTKTEDNFLKSTTVYEHLNVEDWLYDENPKWEHWYDDTWHLQHNPKALETGCDCWPPWEAIRLDISQPMPREEEYSFAGTTSEYLHEAGKHLARRIILKAGVAASEYHDNSSIATAINSLLDESSLDRLILTADDAILESVKNRSRHNLLRKLLHHSWEHTSHYDGRWAPGEEEKARSQKGKHWYEDSGEDYERYSRELDRKYSMAETKEKTRDVITATGAANLLLADRIVNQATSEALGKIKPRFLMRSDNGDPETVIARCSTKIIQTTMRSQRAITQLQEHSPHLAALYITAFSKPEHAYVHAGQIISRMKGQYKLKPAEWKLLCRLAPDINVIANPSVVNAASEITGIIRIMATANRPEADTESLKMLAKETHLHEKHWIRPPRGRKDQHREAWTRTMNAFLAPRGPERKPGHLISVSDAITGTIRAGENWGPGNWETMCNRAERWHRRVRQERKRKSGRAKWIPVVEEYQDGDLTVSPITNQAELRHAADELDNCLSSYYEDCTERGTRIYTYLLNGTTIAGATELIRTESGWALGQTETAYDGTDEEEAKIRRAAKRLLQKHQEAEGRH